MTNRQRLIAAGWRKHWLTNMWVAPEDLWPRGFRPSCLLWGFGRAVKEMHLREMEALNDCKLKRQEAK